MQFIKNKVTFGRHESFALRFGWLTKGFQALEKDPDIFKSDEATVVFGVGKNMVNFIKQNVSVLLRCYMQTKDNSRVLAEEALDSPLSLLKLIPNKKNSYGHSNNRVLFKQL